MNYLALIPIILLLAAGIKPRKTTPTELLSRQTSKALKGLMCIMILFGHIALRSADLNLQGERIFYIFYYLGTLMVSVFFFLSGYGLMCSYQEKGTGYLQHFGKNRLTKVLLPYAVTHVIYVLVYLAFGIDFSLSETLHQLVKGQTFVPYSWFVVEILVFYLLFWFAMAVKKRWGLALAVQMLLFIGICRTLGFKPYWYVKCFAFPFGMLAARYKERLLVRFAQRNARCAWIVLGFCVSVLGWLCTKMLGEGNPGYFLAWQITSCTLPSSIVLLAMGLEWKPGVLEWIGGISYEIYLLQGVWLLVFFDIVQLNSGVVCALFVTATTMGSSYLLHQLDRWMLSRLTS